MYAAWFAVLAAAEGEGGGLGPFSVEPGLIIWTWLVFITLFLLLRRFAWPGIVQATEERERKVAAQLAEAEKANAEAKAALAESQRLAAEARSSAQTMLADARSAAEKERASLLEKAKHEQEELLARARREIGAEKERALTELRREAVDLALGAASKLVGERLSSEADRKLVQEYLDQVEIRH